MSVRDVAVVGAGVAGAALATRLARAGLDVVVLERAPAWHWRAAGVFASPLVVDALRRTGLADPLIDRFARRIPAMRLSTPAGSVVALTYGAERGGPMAIGLDRSGLDPALVELAWTSGAEIRRGVTVAEVRVDGGRARLTVRDGDATSVVEARVVVGADGPHSVVGRARRCPSAGAPGAADRAQLPPGRSARRRRGRRAAGGLPRRLCRHRPRARWAGQHRDRPRAVVARRPCARDGAAVVSARVLGADRRRPPTIPCRGARRSTGRPTRSPARPRSGSVPRGGRAQAGSSSAMPPASSTRSAARACIERSSRRSSPRRPIVAAVRGGGRRPGAAAAYDRAMQRRFATKDGVSWLLQAFLARPAALEYAARRLAARPDARATMGLVMGDLIPAGRALDPRFLAAVLRP